MGKLGKILGPIVAILAILVAVLSFVISNRRMEFRNRAAALSKGVADVTQKLDSQSGTGQANKTTFTAAAPGTQESGSLGWASYKNDPDAYQKTIDGAVKLAADINAQRGELALGIYEMAITLQLPESSLSQENLTMLSGFKDALEDAKSHTSAVRSRNDTMIAALKAYASEVEQRFNAIAFETRKEIKLTDEDGFEVGSKLGDFECQKPLDDLRNAIKDVNDRRKAFEASLKNAPEQIPQYAWTAPVQNLSGNNFQGVLAALEEDYAGINGKLIELEKTLQDLAKVKQEKQKLEEEYAELKEQNSTLEKDVVALRKQVRDLGGDSEIGAFKPLESIREVDPNATGNVLVTNPQWNFVVIDMGQEHIVNDVPVIISSKGKYLASGNVKKVERKVALVEIFRGTTSQIPEGAQVYVNLTSKSNDTNDEDDQD